MQVNIPRITRAIALSDYAPEMGSVVIHTWVNPSREFSATYLDLQRRFEGPDKEAAAAAVLAWYAELWSQHPDAQTHWTAEEVLALGNVDPALHAWACQHSWQAIADHREHAKKK